MDRPRDRSELARGERLLEEDDAERIDDLDEGLFTLARLVVARDRLAQDRAKLDLLVRAVKRAIRRDVGLRRVAVRRDAVGDRSVDRVRVALEALAGRRDRHDAHVAEIRRTRPIVDPDSFVVRLAFCSDATPGREQDARAFHRNAGAFIEDPDERATRGVLRDEREVRADEQRRREERAATDLRELFRACSALRRNVLDGEDVRADFLRFERELSEAFLQAKGAELVDVRLPRLRRLDDSDDDVLDGGDEVFAAKVLFEVEAVGLEAQARDVATLDLDAPGAFGREGPRRRDLEVLATKRAESRARLMGLGVSAVLYDERLVLGDRLLEQIESVVECLRGQESRRGSETRSRVLAEERAQMRDRIGERLATGIVRLDLSVRGCRRSLGKRHLVEASVDFGSERVEWMLAQELCPDRARFLVLLLSAQVCALVVLSADDRLLDVRPALIVRVRPEELLPRGFGGVEGVARAMKRGDAEDRVGALRVLRELCRVGFEGGDRRVDVPVARDSFRTREGDARSVRVLGKAFEESIPGLQSLCEARAPFRVDRAAPGDLEADASDALERERYPRVIAEGLLELQELRDRSRRVARSVETCRETEDRLSTKRRLELRRGDVALDATEQVAELRDGFGRLRELEQGASDAKVDLALPTRGKVDRTCLAVVLERRRVVVLDDLLRQHRVRVLDLATFEGRIGEHQVVRRELLEVAVTREELEPLDVDVAGRLEVSFREVELREEQSRPSDPRILRIRPEVFDERLHRVVALAPELERASTEDRSLGRELRPRILVADFSEQRSRLLVRLRRERIPRREKLRLCCRKDRRHCENRQ